MKTSRTTAGKTAKTTKTAKAKATGVWRETTYKGEDVLVDPAGRVYFGTAAEVRDAHLLPSERESLARSMRGFHSTIRSEKDRTGTVRYCIMSCRRSAIHYSIPRRIGEPCKIPSDVYIMAGAAARYMGRSIDEFLLEAVKDSIDGTIDIALSDGLPELPLTRHERAAFKGRQEDYSLALRLKDALKTA